MFEDHYLIHYNAINKLKSTHTQRTFAHARNHEWLKHPCAAYISVNAPNKIQEAFFAAGKEF